MIKILVEALVALVIVLTAVISSLKIGEIMEKIIEKNNSR